MRAAIMTVDGNQVADGTFLQRMQRPADAGSCKRVKSPKECRTVIMYSTVPSRGALSSCRPYLICCFSDRHLPVAHTAHERQPRQRSHAVFLTRRHFKRMQPSQGNCHTFAGLPSLMPCLGEVGNDETVSSVPD